MAEIRAGWRDAGKVGGCNTCNRFADVIEINFNGLLVRLCRVCAADLRRQLVALIEKENR